MAVTEPHMDKSETLRLLRANLSSLRENVVLAVMRRNKLSDEVTRLEHSVADLETRASLSEKVNNSMLATELREERVARETELNRLRPLLRAAEQEAEQAKLRLPEEEARLNKQIHDLENGVFPTLSQSAPVALTLSQEADTLAPRAPEVAPSTPMSLMPLMPEADAREEVSPLHPQNAPTVLYSAPETMPEIGQGIGSGPLPKPFDEVLPAHTPEAHSESHVIRDLYHSDDKSESVETGSFFDPPLIPIEIPKIITPEPEPSSEPKAEHKNGFAAPIAPTPSIAPTMKSPEEELRELEERLNLIQSQMPLVAPLPEAVQNRTDYLELNDAPVFEPISELTTQPVAEAKTDPSNPAEPAKKREMFVPSNLLLVNTAPPGVSIQKPRKNGKGEPVTETAETAVEAKSEPLAEPVTPETEKHEATETHNPVPAEAVAAVAEVEAAAIGTAVLSEVHETHETQSVSAPEAETAKIPEALESTTEAAVNASLAPVVEPTSEPKTTETAKPDSEMVPSVYNEKTLSREVSPAPTVVTRPRLALASTPKTDRVRVAGIGTGGIWLGAHAPAYVDIPQMKLVAICDPDKTAQTLAHKRYEELVTKKAAQLRQHGQHDRADELERDLTELQIFDSIEEVIAHVKPDLVDICTQPMLHAPLSIQALEAGIHVMCEKPLSRSWLEAKQLIETVQKTGKLYQHNENWLWDRDYYTAKKLIDAGAIGEPILMYLATAHGGPEGNPNFWNPEYGGGGALLDNGIHAIGAAWFLSGLQKKPTLVKAAEPFGMSIRMPERILDGRYQKIEVEDDAHILIRFEDSESLAWTTAHVEGSWSHRDSPDTAVHGTTGKLVFKDEDGHRFALVLDAYDRESRRIEVGGPTWSHWPSSHYGEILNMVECVRHNTPSICSAEFGAECSAIVGAAYLSEMSGRKAVPVEDFKRFANKIADRFPHDPKSANDALVDALLSAVRKG